MLIKSDDIGELAKALCTFQAKAPSIGLDAVNPFFDKDGKGGYASLANIVKTAAPTLAECGLAVTQLLCGAGGVTTILLHDSGQYISDSVELPASKNDPQGHGSAITYARRYGYASILGLVPDKDDDGNAASQPPAKKPPAKPETKKPATQKPKDDELEQAKAIIFTKAKNQLIEAGIAVPTDKEVIIRIQLAAKMAKQSLPFKDPDSVDKAAICMDELVISEKESAT